MSPAESEEPAPKAEEKVGENGKTDVKMEVDEAKTEDDTAGPSPAKRGKLSHALDQILDQNLNKQTNVKQEVSKLWVLCYFFIENHLFGILNPSLP